MPPRLSLHLQDAHPTPLLWVSSALRVLDPGRYGIFPSQPIPRANLAAQAMASHPGSLCSWSWWAGCQKGQGWRHLAARRRTGASLLWDFLQLKDLWASSSTQQDQEQVGGLGAQPAPGLKTQPTFIHRFDLFGGQKLETETQRESAHLCALSRELHWLGLGRV